MNRPSLRALWGLCAGLAVLLLLSLLRLAPSWADALFASGALSALGFALAWAAWPLPVSGADLLLALAVLWLLFRLARTLWRLRRRRGERRSLLGREALHLLNATGLLFALFGLAFGGLYTRTPIESRWQLPEEGTALADLCRWLVDATNAAYVELHGAPDLGHPTPAPAAVQFEPQLGRSLDSLLAGEGEPAPALWPRPRARWPLVSPLMDRLGLSGFYFPWSGEANVNRGMPAIALAHALAHEKAHQRGFAAEDEANFVAILAGLRSEAKISRYASLLFAQRQALRALLLEDPPLGENLLALRHPGVQRDVDALRAYWARFAGPAQEWAHRTNDLYLRAQRVEGGAASYGGSLALLLRYASAGEIPRGGG
jgi:hypothetical protein